MRQLATLEVPRKRASYGRGKLFTSVQADDRPGRDALDLLKVTTHDHVAAGLQHQVVNRDNRITEASVEVEVQRPVAVESGEVS